MQFPRWAPHRLRQLYRTLCLVALVMAGQHGAFVHEIGHLAAAQTPDLHPVGAEESSEANCALCPLFSQVATAAFSHSLQIPPLLRADVERVSEPEAGSVKASIPTPRSRGPPSLG
jgi:hypothetical protein